jgi:putative transposase
MHLTLKKEATKPAAANVLQQQARFDAFVERYNAERPHQALGMKVPADFYVRSPRGYHGLDDLTYPFHDQTITVTHCGRICFKTQKVNLSQVFAGQNVGVTQVGEHIFKEVWVTVHGHDAGRLGNRILRDAGVEFAGFGMNEQPVTPLPGCHRRRRRPTTGT